jgi:TPR repeat protein
MAPPVVSAPPPAAPAPVVAATVAAPVAVFAAPAATQVALPSPTASPAARRIDPDELAMLMKRARSLLNSGDIPPARLLLERAADAEEPAAAFLLAQTYDPEVMGSRDARTITPDPAAARTWYQKAAQLGSMEAQRRLAQMQN